MRDCTASVRDISAQLVVGLIRRISVSATHKVVQRLFCNSLPSVQINGVVQKRGFSGNTGVAIPPSIIWDIVYGRGMTEAYLTSAGSGAKRLRLPKPKQREPMWVSLTRHQLFGAFAHQLSNSAA